MKDQALTLSSIAIHTGEGSLYTVRAERCDAGHLETLREWLAGGSFGEHVLTAIGRGVRVSEVLLYRQPGQPRILRFK